MTLNKVLLIGYMAGDPATSNGATSFTVATSESYTDRDGNKKEVTEFSRCIAFGKTGDFIGKYFSKGKPIFVEGSLRTNKYTDKEGIERQSTQIRVNSVDFLPREKQEGRSTEQASTYQRQYQTEPLDDLPW